LLPDSNEQSILDSAILLLSNWREFQMKKLKDDWAWTDISFAKWRAAVNRRLKSVYAITINDAGIDDEFLTSHWEMKQSQFEFVEWFGTKYDLDPKSAVGL
jgi:hypothetical protein